MYYGIEDFLEKKAELSDKQKAALIVAGIGTGAVGAGALYKHFAKKAPKAVAAIAKETPKSSATDVVEKAVESASPQKFNFDLVKNPGISTSNAGGGQRFDWDLFNNPGTLGKVDTKTTTNVIGGRNAVAPEMERFMNRANANRAEKAPLTRKKVYGVLGKAEAPANTAQEVIAPSAQGKGRIANRKRQSWGRRDGGWNGLGTRQ